MLAELSPPSNPPFIGADLSASTVEELVEGASCSATAEPLTQQAMSMAKHRADHALQDRPGQAQTRSEDEAVCQDASLAVRIQVPAMLPSTLTPRCGVLDEATFGLNLRECKVVPVDGQDASQEDPA